jgi:iron complex transport system substrate-binding protein
MRIASLISAGTEMLFALGLGDQVVAVSHECDWPQACRRWPRVTRTKIDHTAGSQAIDDQVRDFVAAGQPLYEVDAEKLAELQPDLIVTQAQCDVCAIRYDDVLSAMQSTPALRATQIFSLNPQTLKDVLQEMLRLGSSTGIASHAAEVVAGLQSRIRAVERRPQKAIESRPRVAMIEWVEPMMLAGNWVPELVELAGGRCDPTPPGEPSRYHTWDEIRRFNPQIIVVCPCGFDAERAREEAMLLAKLPGWKSLSAVESDNVHILDGNAYFNRPGPRLVDSLELLAEITRKID